MLEELSFEAPDMKMGSVEINAAYVNQRLQKVADDEDLSKFILFLILWRVGDYFRTHSITPAVFPL